jgi:hypothetical protein
VVGVYWKPGQVRTMGWRNGFQTQLEVIDAGKLLILRYQHADKPVELRIPITTTPCQFGGERSWSLCPLDVAGAACGRRVPRLYLDRGLFGCRQCHKLAYKSQNATRSRRV